MRSGGHLLRMARKIFVRFSIARAIHVMVSGLMIGITGPTLAQQTSLPSPVVLNAEQDHRRLLDLLKISIERFTDASRRTHPGSFGTSSVQPRRRMVIFQLLRRN